MASFTGISFYDNVGINVIPTNVAGLSFYCNIIEAVLTSNKSGYVFYFMPF